MSFNMSVLQLVIILSWYSFYLELFFGLTFGKKPPRGKINGRDPVALFEVSRSILSFVLSIVRTALHKILCTVQSVLS